MDNCISRWQRRGAIVGSLAWYLMFEGIEQFRQWGYEALSKISLGYVISFFVGFSGYIIYQAIKGNTKRICDDDPFMIIAYGVGSIVILCFGIFGSYVEVFGNVGPEYNIGFWIGSIVFGWCVVPTIDYYDRDRNRRSARG